MMYEVEGNAALNAQFYVTDSTSHFFTASLYYFILSLTMILFIPRLTM
jgi:hypothetical protein